MKNPNGMSREDFEIAMEQHRERCTIDLRTASVDEMRDWLAVDLHQRKLDKLGPKATTEDYYRDIEPIPATLDAIAAVWRTELVGWWWLKTIDEDDGPIDWIAYHSQHSAIHTPDTGDELTDRLRLTCLALAAERNIQ